MMLAYPNRADVGSTYTPSFSGGSWNASYPLTNLQNRRLDVVARSATAALLDAQFDIDLGTSRGLRLFGIPKHNISTVGKVRIRGTNVAADYTSPVYDTGWLDVWPAIYPSPGYPAWGDSTLWSSSKINAEDAIDYPIGFVHVATSAQSARYWRIEVDDTTNAAGYVELARLYMALGWQPSVNPGFNGHSFGWETDTVRSETDRGVAQFYEKTRRRMFTGILRYLGEDEVLCNWWPLEQLAGTTEQLYFVFDPTDTVHMHRRAFLGVLRTLSPLEAAALKRYGKPFSVLEEL
jgi:hypothetical protein